MTAPAPQAAERLAETHRRAQLALRATLLRDVLRLFPLLDVNRISATWPAFETALVRLIQSRGGVSRTLAHGYYERMREAAGIGADRVPTSLEVSEQEMRKGLVVVGAGYAARQLARGRRSELVEQATLVNVSGEATRHVFNFGRGSLLATIAARPSREWGWRRQTDANPCRWCAERSGRVYPASFHFGAHGHCSCFPQLVPLAS